MNVPLNPDFCQVSFLKKLRILSGSIKVNQKLGVILIELLETNRSASSWGRVLSMGGPVVDFEICFNVQVGPLGQYPFEKSGQIAAFGLTLTWV